MGALRHRWIAGAGCLLLAAQIFAHDNPEQVIEALTAEMARNGATAVLLIERATEEIIIGKFPQAAADLEQALKLEPSSLPARIGLGRVFLAQGKPAEALKVVDTGMDLRASDPEHAALRMVRAEIYRTQGEHKKALADCDRALQLQTGDVDWYVMRSQLQAQLGRHKERLAGLEKGIQSTGSAVLAHERIEALIDAGQPRAALAEIEPQLQTARWQSSWLLRRARARLGLNEKKLAQEDLRAAIQEINERFSSEHPDLALLLDRAAAYALLGETELARKDFQQARASGGEEWFVRRLEMRSGLKGK